jgi:hypothetical protein
MMTHEPVPLVAPCADEERARDKERQLVMNSMMAPGQPGLPADPAELKVAHRDRHDTQAAPSQGVLQCGGGHQAEQQEPACRTLHEVHAVLPRCLIQLPFGTRLA